MRKHQQCLVLMFFTHLWTNSDAHTHADSHSFPPLLSCNWWQKPCICKPNVEEEDRANSTCNPFPHILSFFFSFPICLRPLPHCLHTHSLISRLSHWYEGPGRHCDMLRRQYKYLISPNGNRHCALIAPHIIWGAISVADIPFDPPSVWCSLLLLPHLSQSFLCLCSLFLGHMSPSDFISLLVTVDWFLFFLSVSPSVSILFLLALWGFSSCALLFSLR